MKALTALLLFAAAQPLAAATNIYIGVESAIELKKVPVALSQFLPLRADKPADLDLAESFRDIVRSDLLYSRYFDIEEDALSPANLDTGPEAMSFWKNLAGHLITGRGQDAGSVWTFNARLHDLNSGAIAMESTTRGKSAPCAGPPTCSPTT